MEEEIEALAAIYGTSLLVTDAMTEVSLLVEPRTMEDDTRKVKSAARLIS